MAQRPPRPLVIVADGMLVSMAANPTYRNQFPFLQSIFALTNGRRPRTCGGCGRKKATTDAYARAKAALAALPPAKQQQLKTMLHADKIRVRWAGSDGQQQEVNF